MEEWKNRFDEIEDKSLHSELNDFLQENKEIFDLEKEFGCDDLNECLKDASKKSLIAKFFFGEPFKVFCNDFYYKLNKYNITKRTRLVHDLSNNLRASGTVFSKSEEKSSSLEYIYIIA